ncbi:MAG: formylglycine-generating enzyme family protein [Candidatus Parabeggiatoa sp. nov. 2]|nr:MAG: formylglycine-generating enzyme family protein [Gammaproteobacteria bacterium]HEC84373.1 formylglycine-generating enzyme family protein [Thioploca sp.]
MFSILRYFVRLIFFSTVLLTPAHANPEENSILPFSKGRLGGISGGISFRDQLQDGSLGPEMVIIPAGEFQMGNRKAKKLFNEGPVHTVSINRFAFQRAEVTFADYDRFAEATGREKPDDRGWGRGNRPVIFVSFEDAMAYAAWLSEQTGQRYRLPTEAEWEYAARAGTETNYWWGNQIGKNRAACHGCQSQWGYDAPNEMTAPVCSFPANPFGLCDTVGNVWEWTCSPYQWHYRGAEQRGVFHKTKHNDSRVIRGGSWFNKPRRVRVSQRERNIIDYRRAFVGFRLVREMPRNKL